MPDLEKTSSALLHHDELSDIKMSDLDFAGKVLSGIAANLSAKGLPRYPMAQTHEPYRRQFHQKLLSSKASVLALAENGLADSGIDELTLTSGVLLELANHLQEHGSRARLDLNKFEVREEAQQTAFADRLQSAGSWLAGIVTLQGEELPQPTSGFSE